MIDLKGVEFGGSHVGPSPISPSGRFKQPLSSPSSLYSDLPRAPGDATSPVSPSTGLGSSLFGKTVSAGNSYMLIIHRFLFFF